MSNLLSQVKLKLKQKLVENEIKIAKILNEYFVNIVENLGILTEKESATSTENNLSEVEMALKNTKKPLA